MNVDAVTVEDLERDPYPIYAELRETAPAVYMPCLDTWMILRWEGATEASTDPERFPAHVDDSPTDRALGGISMMTTDGEPAKQRRRPFDSTFRPRAVESRMPKEFDRICDEQLDEIGESDRADLVADYFEPVSLRSLAIALGIEDLVDLPTLRRWFAGLAAGVSNYENDPDKNEFCSKVSVEIDTVLRPRFEHLLDYPNDSTLSVLVNARGGSLEDRISWAMPSLKLVLLGGLQEPAHGGATIAYCLLAHPDQLRAVQADGDLLSQAVEEGLRWTAPIGNLLRGISEGAEVEGMKLPAGERAIIVVASANRDASVWGDTAEEFDIYRPKRTHLAFATGPHYCIGHHFARVQLRTAIAKLIKRFPRIELDPGQETVLWGHEYRSPKSVFVNLY
jgi:cytochrome P450